MSFYRSILAAVAAIAIASPVFADDTTTTTTTGDAPAAQATDSAATTTTTTTTSDASATEAATDVKVDLNKASAKDLMKIKGLNASKARSIVAYRKKHGDFKTTEDLMNVKGFKKMKPDTLKEISDQLTVQ